MSADKATTVVLLTLLTLLLARRTVGAHDELRKAIESADTGMGYIVDDSGVQFIQSKDFDALAKRGPRILSGLLVIMRDDDSSFDTFVRCWHVANQIVKTKNSKRRILWYGGVSTKGDKIEPGGLVVDVQLFKRRVTDDMIEAAAAEFGLRIGETPNGDRP